MECYVLIQTHPSTKERYVAFTTHPMPDVEDLRLTAGEWADAKPTLEKVTLFASKDVESALGESEFRSAADTGEAIPLDALEPMDAKLVKDMLDRHFNEEMQR